MKEIAILINFPNLHKSYYRGLCKLSDEPYGQAISIPGNRGRENLVNTTDNFRLYQGWALLHPASQVWAFLCCTILLCLLSILPKATYTMNTQ